MVKATDFKFDTHLLRDNANMTPKNFFSKSGRGQDHMTPKNWGLNANSFKMVKATDFKFDIHLLRDVTPRSWSPLPQLIVACPANNSSVSQG